MSRSWTIALAVLIIVGVALWWNRPPPDRRAPPQETSETAADTDTAPPTDTTWTKREPASTPKNLEQQADPRLQALLGGQDRSGKILLEGFQLAARADGDEQAMATLQRFTEIHFRPEARALELAEYGLTKIPRSPEYARERAGLLSMLDKFGPKDAATAEIFIKELTAMEHTRRLDVNEARDEEERNQALSLGMQEAAAEAAIEGWLMRQESFPQAERAAADILRSLQNPVLRQNLYHALVTRWPDSKGEIENMVRRAGLPLEQIRHE